MVQQCEVHGDVVVAQRLEREHLSTASRALASEYVSSPTERLIGSFLFQVLLEQPHFVDVLHAEHSRVTGSGLRESFSC